MGNSQENRNHTAESAMDRSGWIPRGSLMSKLAQIGVLLFCTANPDNAFASLSPKTVDMSYGQKNTGDGDDSMIYSDTEEKCVKSSEQMLKIGSEASSLIKFTDSLDNPASIATVAQDFIRLAEKYDADVDLIRSILSKKNISKVDKKYLIEQAKNITKVWVEITKEHHQNLTAFYSILTDKASKADIKLKIAETMEIYGSLAGHIKFLDDLMNQ